LRGRYSRWAPKSVLSNHARLYSLISSCLTPQCVCEYANSQLCAWCSPNAEGNPWCNTKLSAQENNQYWNMSAWSSFTWSIISGKKPPPDNLFKLSWSWGKFQAYNMIAAKMLAPLGVQMLDVVPMTRLRPTVDWGIRSGKNIDCLHGNPAVRVH